MEKVIEPVIEFVLSLQEPGGGFPTYESYPIVNPDAGWTRLPDASPFITANVLFSLMQLNNTTAVSAAFEKGVQSLLTAKEGIGFWRFWPANSKQHPVPLDMDVTCIVLFVLNRCGHTFKSDKILLNNKSAGGYFETWLGPRISMWPFPAVAFNFLKDYGRTKPTQKLGYFAFNDKEPAVAANVVLHLGENKKTQPCIDQIISEVKTGDISKQFYHHDIVVCYHISRAYANGVQGFKVLGPVIAAKICAYFNAGNIVDDDMLCAMAANVLLNFNREIELAEKLIIHIASSKSYPDKWTSSSYFCSKDHNFFSGSPALSAGIFVEACANLNRYK